MKTKMLVLGLVLAAIAFAASVTCPIDKFSMHFTGETQVVSGKLLYKYKCGSGHVTWVVQ